MAGTEHVQVFVHAHNEPALPLDAGDRRLAISMGSRQSQLIGYRVELTQGDSVRAPSFLKFPVP
jgi:hypothetical protein